MPVWARIHQLQSRLCSVATLHPRYTQPLSLPLPHSSELALQLFLFAAPAPHPSRSRERIIEQCREHVPSGARINAHYCNLGFCARSELGCGTMASRGPDVVGGGEETRGLVQRVVHAQRQGQGAGCGAAAARGEWRECRGRCCIVVLLSMWSPQRGLGSDASRARACRLGNDLPRGRRRCSSPQAA